MTCKHGTLGSRVRNENQVSVYRIKLRLIGDGSIALQGCGGSRGGIRSQGSIGDARQCIRKSGWSPTIKVPDELCDDDRHAEGSTVECQCRFYQLNDPWRAVHMQRLLHINYDFKIEVNPSGFTALSSLDAMNIIIKTFVRLL